MVFLGKSNQIDNDWYIAVRSLLARQDKVNGAVPPYDYSYIDGAEAAYFLVPGLAKEEEFEYCGKGIYGEMEHCLRHDISCFFVEGDDSGDIVSYPILGIDKHDTTDYTFKYGTFTIDTQRALVIGKYKTEPAADDTDNTDDLFMI